MDQCVYYMESNQNQTILNVLFKAHFKVKDFIKL